MNKLRTAIAIANLAMIFILSDTVVRAKKSTAAYFNNDNKNQPDGGRPLILAHRGSSGLYPEHSEAAYKAAYLSGADFIETDLVLSKDGVLIACHDVTLSSSVSNINDIAKFADKKNSDDGKFYLSDFTAAELKQVKHRQRYSSRSQLYND